MGADGLGSLFAAWSVWTRGAAKRAFHGFLDGKILSANQIQFVNLVVEYLTQSGWMSPAQLYESPFTDFSPRGIVRCVRPRACDAIAVGPREYSTNCRRVVWFLRASECVICSRRLLDSY
jgi:hypothetical protein